MLIITLGDPYSINSEMISPLLPRDGALPYPIVLIGSLWHWQDQHQRLGWNLPRARSINYLEEAKAPGLYFLDCPAAERGAEGCSPQERGKIATDALEALENFLPSHPLAVLTCPINKYNCAQAGFKDIGQTEFFQRIWRAKAIMVLAGPRLRVGLATNHIPLAQVSAALSIAGLVEKISLFHAALHATFGILAPRIAVSGLNPHNGEAGLCSLGEEERVIIPALRESGLAEGPFPADTVFYQALQGKWDGVLAMYHDQGLAPFKTLHFDDGINVSGGLPYLRVSPDHGPVSDLFLSRSASAQSFQRAWNFAERYLKGKSTSGLRT